MNVRETKAEIDRLGKIGASLVTPRTGKALIKAGYVRARMLGGTIVYSHWSMAAAYSWEIVEE